MAKSKQKANHNKLFKNKILIVFVLLFAAIGTYLLINAFAATSYSLKVNPSAPKHHDTVTFTGTFPQDAFRQSRQPQYPGNPQISINCWDTSNGQNIMRQGYGNMFKKGSKNTDGSYNSTSLPIVLDQNSNGIVWPDGINAECSVNTYYVVPLQDGSPNIIAVASLMMSVGP